MKPISALVSHAAGIRVVLVDIDDTLTTEGRLGPEAYDALWRLQKAGLALVPVTGRPAGWCDHIARMWPVTGVVGENGALAFAYEPRRRRMRRLFSQSEVQRRQARERLEALRTRIQSEVPGCGIASDQPYRLHDLAVDICEDVNPLPDASIQRILDLCRAAGATAKVSSIHVNAWFGDFDKLTMVRRFAQEILEFDIEAMRGQVVYVGDSPNDEPAFAYFPHSVGVANVRDFVGSMASPPSYVTERRCGEGFVEVAEVLLAGSAQDPRQLSGSPRAKP